jgi:hypothetical protein
MVEAVGSFESRGPGFVGMSSTLEEVQMQETLAFSETIKVGSSFHQIRVPRCILLLHLVSFPFQLFQKHYYISLLADHLKQGHIAFSNCRISRH